MSFSLQNKNPTSSLGLTSINIPHPNKKISNPALTNKYNKEANKYNVPAVHSDDDSNLKFEGLNNLKAKKRQRLRILLIEKYAKKFNQINNIDIIEANVNQLLSKEKLFNTDIKILENKIKKNLQEIENNSLTTQKAQNRSQSIKLKNPILKGSNNIIELIKNMKEQKLKNKKNLFYNNHISNLDTKLNLSLGRDLHEGSYIQAKLKNFYNTDNNSNCITNKVDAIDNTNTGSFKHKFQEEKIHNDHSDCSSSRGFMSAVNKFSKEYNCKKMLNTTSLADLRNVNSTNKGNLFIY